MALFQRLIWSALFVAVLVGSGQCALQQWQAVPIIQAAEVFESQKAEPAAPAVAHDHDHHHDEDEHAWAPADGLERTAWTWVANVLHAFSLALLVFAVMGLWVWRQGVSLAPLRLGMVIAAIGWISLHLWPSLGLPAEVPGMDAAPLGSRQSWWVLAAACSGLACAGISLLRTPWRWPAAVALLALPFALGAPHLAGDPLAGFGASAQASLRHLNEQFRWVTAWMSIALWASLGLTCGLAFARWLQPTLAAALAAPVMKNANLRSR